MPVYKKCLKCNNEFKTKASHFERRKYCSRLCMDTDFNGLGKLKYNVLTIAKYEYSSYNSMKGRCLRPGVDNFRLYGGRGIKICDRWLKSFNNFYEDMGPKPTPKHQIDRIDPDGNYEPDNCKWSTNLENNRNKRISKSNQWRFVIIDKTKLCKKCIKLTEHNEEEIKIKENLNQMSIV